MFFFFKQKTAYEILVRSRGLGDVYKRQAGYNADTPAKISSSPAVLGVFPIHKVHGVESTDPVSYTHLTLPTSDLV